MTPLHLTAKAGHLEIVKRLIEKGANLDVENNDGCTALQLAAQNDRVDAVELLRKYTEGNSQPKSDLHDVSAFRPSNLKHSF